jgi:tRNA G18 (ribose-2'-O)-methylase SpoU
VVSSPWMLNRQLEHHQVRNLGRVFPLRVVANDLDDPLNVGSLFRLADALGVEHLHLTGSSARPPNSRLHKTSRSAEKHVSYSWSPDAVATVRSLRAQGYTVVALEITSASMDIRRFHPGPDDKICLVLGGENAGVPQELLDISDCTLHIPMAGTNSSMNVAMACAIAVFEITGKMALCRTDDPASKSNTQAATMS